MPLGRKPPSPMCLCTTSGELPFLAGGPRAPCVKLAIRFGRPDMLKRFLKSQRTGFYFGVVEEGSVQAGDKLEPLSKHPDRLAVSDVTRLYTTERSNADLLRKAIAVSALPESWRSYFVHQLEKLER